MNVHDAALAWHDAGACVLPAADDGSKRPGRDCLVKVIDPDGRERWVWDPYKTARPTREQVDTWAGRNQGIGIVCGNVSGNVEMFEAEGAAFEAGLVGQLTAMLPEELTRKLNTYVERSPKGGVHWIFRVDGVPVKGNTKLAKQPVEKTEDNPSGVQVLFETRGEGGWTVAAPSHGSTHPTGKPWQVVYGTAGVIPLLTAEEYRLLHACAATFDLMPEVHVQLPPVVVGKDSDGSPGQDFETKATWEEVLTGWTPVRRRGDVTEWVRPGKNPRDGISATTGHKGDWLYVFTTSTEFESERTYTKFGAYALLQHGGNFSTAARALRQAGYGAKREAAANPFKSVPTGTSVTDGTPGPTATPEQQPPETPPTWAEIDLSEFLDGTFVPLYPDLFRREDGFCLVYKGKTHSFHGESESGKSWLGLYAIACSLMAGQRAAMIDFESDARTIVGRLLALGVDPEAIRERFSYRRPEVDPNIAPQELFEWQKLLCETFEVVVLDGVTDALGIYRCTSVDNDEVTAWIRKVPKTIAWHTGAAVILIDHVTKDADTRGRFAIGAQAKMSNLDGAAYSIEVMDPMGIGMIGRISMRVGKDRNGTIRPKSGPYRKGDRTQQTAIVVLDSSQAGRTTVKVEMWTGGEPDPETGQTRGFQPTGLMERVSRQLEGLGVPQSRGAIDRAVSGRREFILQAIDCLIADGHAIEDGPGTGGHPTVRLIRPYRENGAAPVPGTTPPDDPSPETRSEGRTRSRPIGPGTTGTGTAPVLHPFPERPRNDPGTTLFEPEEGSDD